jgi:hypothetical protein
VPLGLIAMNRRGPHRVALDPRGLIGDSNIFRISQGAKRDPAVEIWLRDVPTELQSIAQPWFMRMRQCGEDVRELIHDGCPVVCVDDAPFGYVNSFKNHVNVGFFYGALLKDPAHLLEGTGKRMRHVKLKPGGEPNTAALRALIDAAYLDIRERLGRRLQ